MKLPDFPLAPWEVPRGSDIPLVAPADLRARALWCGRETECLIRAIQINGEERLFYREAGSSEVGNWFSESEKIADVAHYAALTYQSDLRFTHKNSARLFYLDGARYGGSGAHQLIVTDEGGEWRSPHGRARFDLPNWGERFYHWRAAQVGRWAKGELERSGSDVRFAFDWLQLTQLEKQSLVFGISPEDLEQIKLLMRYVLHSDKWLERELWADSQYSEFAHCAWIFYPFDAWSQGSGFPSSLIVADEVHTETYEPYFDEYNRPEFPSIPARLVKWRRLLYRHFHLLCDEETLRRVHAIHDLRAKQIEVTAQMPTAHEKLESVVALREWFTQVHALAEFENLMNG